MMHDWFFANKTLQGIGYPKDWKYNPTLCASYSEKYKLTDMQSGEKTYLYLSDFILYYLERKQNGNS